MSSFNQQFYSGRAQTKERGSMTEEQNALISPSGFQGKQLQRESLLNERDAFLFHRWIQEGRAKILLSAQDAIQNGDSLFSYCRPMERSLSQEETRLFSQLPDKQFALKEICENINIPIDKLYILIMQLIIKKFIEERPGFQFVKSLSHCDCFPWCDGQEKEAQREWFEKIEAHRR